MSVFRVLVCMRAFVASNPRNKAWGLSPCEISALPLRDSIPNPTKPQRGLCMSVPRKARAWAFRSKKLQLPGHSKGDASVSRLLLGLSLRCGQPGRDPFVFTVFFLPYLLGETGLGLKDAGETKSKGKTPKPHESFGVYRTTNPAVN